MASVKSLKINNSPREHANVLTKNLNSALDHLLTNTNVDIINLSLQFNPDQIAQDLYDQTSLKLQKLVDKGCLIISASGNTGFIAFPGIISSVVTVGILKDGYDLESFSNGIEKQNNIGREIDFFLETYENNLIIPSDPKPFPFSDLKSSEATAIFAGILALKKSLKRTYNQSELKTDLKNLKKQRATLPNLKVYTLDINQFLKN
jgi:subtilisin family serine protease